MRNTLRNLTLATAVALGAAFLAPAPAHAQVTTFQTSLASPITSVTQRQIQVASVGTSSLGIWAPNNANAALGTSPSIQIYVDTELMDVEAANGTLLTVRRGAGGTRAQTHLSGATVYAGQPNVVFFSYPQWGSCTAASQISLPVIDVVDQYVENCVNNQWTLLITGTVNYPQTLVVPSAYTNATTTFSAVFSSGIPVHAGLSYTVRCDIVWQGSASTAGPKYEFTGPSSPAKVVSSAVSAVTSSTFTQASATALSTSMANAGTVTTATNFHDTVTLGMVNGANSGTLMLMAAANGSGTLTIEPGSFCVQQ
jgi:hypothetical protein